MNSDERRQVASSERTTLQENSLAQKLVDDNLITEEQLQYVLLLSQENGRKVEQTLVEQGFLTPQQLAILMSCQLSIPFINLKIQPVDPKALALIPESMAREYGVMPLCIIDEAIVVVMEDPENAQAIAKLASSTGRGIERAVGIPQDIHEAIDWNYKSSGGTE